MMKQLNNKKMKINKKILNSKNNFHKLKYQFNSLMLKLQIII